MDRITFKRKLFIKKTKVEIFKSQSDHDHDNLFPALRSLMAPACYYFDKKEKVMEFKVKEQILGFFIQLCILFFMHIPHVSMNM